MKSASLIVVSLLMLVGCAAPAENSNGGEETEAQPVGEVEQVDAGEVEADNPQDAGSDMNTEGDTEAEEVDQSVVTELSEEDLCVEYDYYEEQVNNALEGMGADFEGTRIVYSEVIFDLGTEAQGFSGPEGRIQDSWVDWTDSLVNFGTVGQIETRKYTDDLAEEAVEHLTRMRVASDSLNSLCL